MQSSIRTSIPIVINSFNRTNRISKRLENIFLNTFSKNTIASIGKINQPHSVMSAQDESPIAASDKVYVQSNPDKDILTISFQYNYDGKLKQFNLYRKGSEPLAAALERIKLNLLKMSKSKQKKQSKDTGAQNMNGESYELGLSLNGKSIDPNTTNIEAWTQGAVLDLNGRSFEVRTNDPQVTVLKLSPCIMQGFITMPIVTVENCNINDCEFVWFRRISAGERDKIMKSENLDQQKRVEPDSLNRYWYRLSNGITYSPTQDDLAHHLRIICRPCDGQKEGPMSEHVSEKPVEVGPINCPFEKRHSHTSDILLNPNEFRCVSYNILADLYADSDYSRTVLFNYCPSYALDIDYRRQLILKEIDGYNADIICLQEVDKKEFARTYEPFFTITKDHVGIFDAKGSQVAEGVATFFRNDKFELIDTHRTILRDLIEPASERPSAPEGDVSDLKGKQACQQTETISKPHIVLGGDTSEVQKCLSKFDMIRSAISANDQLRKRFINRHTVLQTSLLKFKSCTNKFLLVANTHLYFAPDADHVRLLQGSVCVKYLEYLKEFYRENLIAKSNELEPDISVVFCGDMNSVPECGLYKLVTEGKVTDDLPDWSSNEDEKVVGLSVETSLRLSPAYDNLDYTNYTPGFNGRLDYIYYEQDNLICKKIVPVPDHDDVIATGGIPSAVFPSDHLALIAELKHSKRS